MARKKKKLSVNGEEEGQNPPPRRTGRNSISQESENAILSPSLRTRNTDLNLKEESDEDSMSVDRSESAFEDDESSETLQKGDRKRTAPRRRDRKDGRSGRSRSRAKEVNYQEQESSMGTDDFGELDSDVDRSDDEAETDELLTVGNVQVPGVLLGELVSSYLVLRAFSWQLKLSPFPLESFIEAIVAERPNRLIDEVHVCLMRALVVDEGKTERQDRMLDLDNLDFITWPSFVWEWLVSEGYSFKTVDDDSDDEEEAFQKSKKEGRKGGKSSKRPKKAAPVEEVGDVEMEDIGQRAADGNILRQLFGKSVASKKKNSRPEYHELSLDIKSSVMQTLCDSLLDRPFIRAEIDRREEGGEGVTGIGGKEGQFAMMTPEEMEEAMAKAKEDGHQDFFSESCVLCGLGGVLMCCDTCPAAYHTRCAGEEYGDNMMNKSTKWRCPECLAGGRGEAAGLRLAVAGRAAGDRARVYTYNGTVLCSHAAPVSGKGVTAWERSESCSVRVLHGDDGKQVVDNMRLPKKQRLDPTSLAAVGEGKFPGWPDQLPDGINSYVNKYEWGWISTSAALRSHVEDLKKKRGNDKLWCPHGTVGKAQVVELPAPLGISLYEWVPMRSPNSQNVSTLRCGKCFSCLRPNLRKPCMEPVKKSAGDEESHSKLGYVSALLSKMERDFWPLAEKQWAGADGGHMFRNKWITGVRDATTAEELANLMLQLEAALRPTCFRAHWYKYYPASLMPGGVSIGGAGGLEDPEDGPMDANDTSRSRDQYDIGSDMSIAEFSKSQGEWEEKNFDNTAAPPGSKRLGPPKFLIRQAVLNAGRKPIPGVKYRYGTWKMNNDRLKWISEVEGCKTVSDLALAIRKLEAALRWDSATRPRFVVDDVSVRGKRLDEYGIVEYALVKAKPKKEDGGDTEAEEIVADEDDDPDAVPPSAVWAAETNIPLWVIKGYEELQRRSSARETIQAMHIPRDDPTTAPSAQLCGQCYNTNASHEKSTFTPQCKVCLRQFHGLCLIMTDEEVQAAKEGQLTATRAAGSDDEDEAQTDGTTPTAKTSNANGRSGEGWTCVGCTVNEKLIARLVKTARAGQHLPGTVFGSNTSAEKWKSTGSKKPGRPAKPFFERSDYCVAERKELLRRLKAAENPDLFKIDADDRFSLNSTSLSYDEIECDGKNPTKCTVCRYPDLGRPLIPCSGCSREFHAECFGIVSVEPHHWNAKTIKCAECLGKRVRAPAEAVILAAIEAAQAPTEDAASIQDRVKQRSQRSRIAKEAQIAEDAKRANWMEAADRVLTRIYRMQVAEAFRFPVPTEILTDYTNYVEHPMDLETIRDELYTYESPFDVVKNMKLIVDNCLAYNGPEAKVTGQGQHMMKSFMRVWKKEGLPLPGDDIAPDLLARVGGTEAVSAAPEEDDGPYLRVAHLLDGEPAPDWVRRIGKVLGQLSKLECVVEFLTPVPKNTPSYYEIIRRPMDFKTIKTKLIEGKYLDPSQVLLDVDLIWQNCLTYNNPDALIIQDLNESKEEFEKLWAAGKVMVPIGDGVVIKKDEDGAKEPGSEWMEPARSVLYRLINFVPQASWFYEPVDERDVPGYRALVDNPVCLKQISDQLNAGQYASAAALWADVELIVRNSETFNGPDNEITEGARLVFSSFKKYWKNLNLAHPSDDGSLDAFFDTEWISSSLACIDGVLAHPLCDPFAAPVNERTAPGYTKVIKRPMDFSTIKYNLEKGSYQSALQVAEDISLIFSNCRAYNPSGEEVRAMGTMVEAMIRQKWESAELPVPKRWRRR